MEVVEAVKSDHTKVVHGNTMTAAAVCANVIQLVHTKGLGKKVFLTGSTSKVGKAVALYLANRGFEVVCYTVSEERYKDLVTSLPKTAEGSLSWASDMQQGADIHTWIVGKHQPEVNKYMPYAAEAVVYAVPSPLDQRRRFDLRITNGTTTTIHPLIIILTTTTTPIHAVTTK